ncbi:NACHT, LRR and PYD domains-containing protein 5 [Coregonus clupeaformis]|uniref:NACHT, LRR and PYD domains-containing protein 5 n=2 Tax=Coregonus clupeaformis TaxID=59861 RepID=UPI001E1C7E8F|nr:NACHT, LRR and PYD domains-containing protein 5 [Coregonus clupeaformis]
MSHSGEREEENTASKMSHSGEREEENTASKMSLFGVREERGTASKRKYSEREEGATASKKSLTQDTSSKSVQKPRAESPTPSREPLRRGKMSEQQMKSSDYQLDYENVQDPVETMEGIVSQGAVMFTHNPLGMRSQTLLTVQQDIKAKLKHKYQHISEGIGHHGNQSLLKDIYTELYITEGGSGGVNNEHEVRQIEMASKKQTTQETPIKCNDIFKPLPGQDKPIRTVLTKGIAGIGKTVSVQKVILDWAEGKANQDVNFMFPLPFRDLNLKKDQYSLMQLLSHYFSELKEIDNIEDGETKTVFIFDGLDECRLPLDFKNNERCCDVTKPTSVDVLLTNLIKGNLLPSALLWITSRPAAANQIPPECVDQVTEVRGFNDPQKEEYFRKKITDQNLANEIIKHMKTSRSLHIMCHMPVFCWISATVLEMMLKEAEKDEVPKTQTQMYTHFTLIQFIVKNRKYNKATETNPKELSQSDKEMILKLAKLAFQQLQKGNLIFYEEDLRECGLDVTEASEYSALCTEIFKEESGLNQEKVYSFVHLSIQEFLAAVHALESCLDKKEHVFSPTSEDEEEESIQLFDLHRRAVDQALKSENGHLDLFLRFLLGLSLESNQNRLQGLLTQTGSTTQSNEETVERTVRYLSDNIEWESSPERIINLFHCLNELGANSLVEEMQTSLRSGTLSETELEPQQCSALAYLLLMSEEVLEEFDLKTYTTSETGYQRLMPVVKTCKRALLSGCKLTYESCETLASALQTPNSPLRELDLSYNDLGDRGVELLCVGLTSPLCNIQTLVLSGCLVTEEGCAALSSALRSNPSHLKELDLSYNHPGDSAGGLLSAALVDPTDKLMKLNVDHGGEFRLKSGLRKYACHLTLDPNTANPHLILSEGNRKVTRVEEKQHYEDHPDRFDHHPQVLCREVLSGSRYYWEVERGGYDGNIGVAYRGMKRKGKKYDSWIGANRKSWGLFCYDGGYHFFHAGVRSISIPGPVSNRVGVYLDWPAGTLSFYSVSSSGTLTHLYTEHTTFTEPLYPGFGVYSSSSVTLCQIDDQHIQRDHGGECCIKPGPEKWIPQSCKTCDHVEDSTHWLQIEPLTSTVQGVTMFRHRSPKGRYECTVSGLRWVCDRDVILKYHFRNWYPYSHLLKDMQYGQGGPLLDITMELGELEEVHLPHFVCLGTNPSLRNEMKILNVEEHGVSVEEVHEVTRFHAKILHPKFSVIAVILSYIFTRNIDVHCELMLYLSVKKQTLIPRLYLFPSNPSQIQAVEQQEKSEGSSRVLISRPEQAFKLNSYFRLNIPCSTYINPPKIHLIHRDSTPSFFKAVLKMTGVDIEMELFGDDERIAWKEVVSQDEYITATHSTSAVLGAGRPAESSLTGSTAQQLRSVRTEFVRRVSGPVLDGLLDGLLQHTVINQEEMESVKVIAERAEKARDIIDMVLRKGTESCSRMINLLGELDPYLWSQLQI